MKWNAVPWIWFGTRLDDDIDDATSGIAILGGEVTRLKAEFLHGIRIRKWQARVQIRVVMAGGIELEIHLALRRAVHARRLFAGVVAALAADSAGVASQVHGPCRQIHQPLRPPSLERELHNLLLADQLGAGSRSRHDQLRLPVTVTSSVTCPT